MAKLFVFGAPNSGADAILTTIYAGQCDGACVVLPWGQTAFGGWETSSGSASGGYDFTNFDARINKQLSLGAAKVVVLLQPIAFGGSNTFTPSYVFTTGWATTCSSPTGQLSTAASAEYPGNGSIPNNTTAQGVDNTAFPAAFQVPFVTAWNNAVTAALNHMKVASYASKVEYVRVGGGAGAEWLVYSGTALQTLCSPATLTGLQNTWTAYMNSVQLAMKATASGFNFASSTNGGSPAPFNIPYNFADAESVVCVTNGFGLGNQGLQNNDISTYLLHGTTSGGAATVGWSSNGFIHNFFLGGAPFYECQTLDVSNPAYVGSPPRGVMGSLVDLLPFAVLRGATDFELYFQDWQVAYDPTNSFYATYHSAYLTTFTNLRTVTQIVHSTSQFFAGGTTPRTITIPSTVAGNTLVVTCQFQDGGPTTVKLGTNSFTLYPSSAVVSTLGNNAGFDARAFVLTNIPGGATSITITDNGFLQVFGWFSIYELTPCVVVTSGAHPWSANLGGSSGTAASTTVQPAALTGAGVTSGNFGILYFTTGALPVGCISGNCVGLSNPLPSAIDSGWSLDKTFNPTNQGGGNEYAFGTASVILSGTSTQPILTTSTTMQSCAAVTCGGGSGRGGVTGMLVTLAPSGSGGVNCPTQLTGGHFQNPLGQPIANGFLRMQLTTDTLTCTFDGQLIAGRNFRVPLDSNGNIAGTVLVEPNDLLTPPGSAYRVQLFDNKGAPVWTTPHLWTILSSATVDVGTLIPT